MTPKNSVNQRYKILIVEDSYEAGKFIKTALEAMDHPLDVMLLPSAEEAILAWADATFDLMIVDIQLPGMNGIELVKRIRQKDRGVRVIMQTGIQDEHLLAMLDAIQLDGFIQKPFKVGQILDAVKTAIDLSHQHELDNRKKSPVLEEVEFQHPEQVELSLRELTQRLGAAEAIVLDANGKDLFHVCLGPSSTVKEMVPAILNARTAARDLQPYVESDSPRNVLVMRGKATDILIATIHQLTLVLLLNTGSTALKVSLAFEELIHIQDSFTRELVRQPEAEKIPPAIPEKSNEVALEELQQARISEEPEMIAEIGLSDESFEELLTRNLEEMISLEDSLDTFWESAADSKFQDFNQKNLSYEEAKKRGVGPIP